MKKLIRKIIRKRRVPAGPPPVENIVRRFCKASRRDIMIAAHRGAWADAPENSLSALAAAISLKLDIVEMDVRRTADGQLVIMHDASVDRTTNGTGLVAELTLEQLRQLRLRQRKGGPDQALTDEPVPTLEEAVRATRGKILFNLDAKDDVCGEAYELLRRMGATGQVLFKRRVSISDPPIGSIAPFSQMLHMPVLVQRDGPVGPALRHHLDPPPPAVELVFKKTGFAKKGAKLARQAGCRAWVNTVNPKFCAGLVDAAALEDPDNVWGHLVELGFSVILTDEPAALQTYLKASNKRVGKRRPAPPE